ncbi:ArsR/SmtB family transcription factor [Peteryoungia ipomoeae]|uniref:Helix-turn-helix transcriptional regulator n=1 Tax=Peteryoungia ipomoeae TaxID=1210932 RepID=A0A4S8P457_9HYPH|nr:metalloregulator ArsR/SmtB family transcription factor [Peteryoungia ipomoeae]THV24758.1 helix-turn-helix transcriptional regulator [Peteryoungia ipomoeae]
MVLEDIMKALAHPARMEILIWLKKPEEFFDVTQEEAVEGVSAGQFERSGLSQSAVSAHLATLQRAGLISSKRVGQRVLYRREENAISDFVKTLNGVL